MASTKASNRRSSNVDDEMERKAMADGVVDEYGQQKAPLPESDEEELGIDGKPKHRFYNEELERKTKEIQD